MLLEGCLVENDDADLDEIHRLRKEILELTTAKITSYVHDLGAMSDAGIDH